MNIDAIQVRERHRRDLGDLDQLAESIKKLGLINRLTVSPSGVLIAGERRLAACRILGWTDIPVEEVSAFEDAKKALEAERDENECRKDMTPSEKVALGQELEKLERPAAKARQSEAGKQHGRGIASENFTEAKRPQTRDAVGQAIGMSGISYERARRVVRASEDDSDPEAQKVAIEARDEMDRTGKVTPAHDRVAAATGRAGAGRKARAERPSEPRTRNGRLPAEQRAEQIRELAEGAHIAAQIADKLGIGEQQVRNIANRFGITLPDAALGKTKKIDPVRVVRETVLEMEGTAFSLKLLSEGDVSKLDPADAAVWAESMAESLRPIKRLARQLKEVS